jgi:transposase
VEKSCLEHEGEFSLLEWPGQSPDLNPIEHLWDEMKRAVPSMNVPLSNLQQLHDAIASAWINIPLDRFRLLVEFPEEFWLFWRERGF